MSLDKIALLAALQAAVTTVAIDGMGEIKLRQISVGDNDAIRIAAKKDAAASEFGLRLVLACVVDDAGAALLTPDDLEALRTSAGTKVDKLVEAVLLHNGYVKPDEKNAPS